MGSGRVPTCIGLVAVLAVLATLSAAPARAQQPVRRVTALDVPFGETERRPDDMPYNALIPPKSQYQPPREPDEPDIAIPEGHSIPVPNSKTRDLLRPAPRYPTEGDVKSVVEPDGTRKTVLVGGWVIYVASRDGKEATEFAADELVVWTRGANADIQKGFSTDDTTGRTEIYMSGRVIVRSTQGNGPRKITNTLRAEEVYYDVENNKAIAVRADLELTSGRVTDPFHLQGAELRRLDAENWEVLNGTVNGSKLPSDPRLRLDSERFTLNERKVLRRNIFGIPVRNIETGEQVEEREQIITGRNVVTRLAGVPVTYLPALRMNANDPLGPLQGVSFSQNRIFGTQFYTTWDLYDLIGLVPPAGHKWRLSLDYLSARGPAAGTDYTYRVPGETPGDLPIGTGWIKIYGIKDHGEDILGGDRGLLPTHPDFRGRAMWRHQQEITDELYFQGQIGFLSDPNFLEQYYKNEFNIGPNQETFAYLAWQRRNFGATALVEDRINRHWVDETNSLPRVKGHLIGQTFLDDLFVYSARGEAGYLQSRPTEYNPYPLLSTDKKVDAGRFDLWQELSVPLSLGPVKFAPYGIVEATEYTSDLNGNEIGRIYGAGGARASLPFSRLYEDVSSELLNLRGLYHKITFGADYRYAKSNVPFTQLPLFDRLNDDATDQGWRNITPYQPLYVPGPNGLKLANAPGYSPFNPQLYAIRRVVENRIDTLDDINVLQADVRQRFQTKRGYPGAEHTVDFLSLDVSASYFPNARRDNFGHPFAFLEWAGTWNVGDRTALVSNGWFEPYEGGSRYWTAGVFLNRTDRTSFYLGYRQTDPLNSKAVTLSVNYQLSHKYYVTAGTSYDFGLSQALSNSFTLVRTGTDLTVSVGLTYNAFVNNLSFQFLVIPNLAMLAGNNFSPQGLAPRR